jgi:two-component system, NtrC family, nitrogen regulation sensor histidine kinase NtrY
MPAGPEADRFLMNSDDHKRRSVILFLSGFVVFLLILAVIPQAFDLNPLWASPGRQTTLLLWALTSLNVILLVSCSLILLRNLLKLYFERRSQQLGSKFRTKLVFAFLGLSFIPVIFMSFFAYFLLNRAVDKWFSEPIDRVVDNAEELVQQVRRDSVSNAIQGAKYLANHPVVKSLLTSQTETNVLELASISSDFDISVVLCLDKLNRPLYLFKEGKLYPASHPDFRRVAGKVGLIRWDGENPELAGAVLDGIFGRRDPKNATLTTLDEDGRDIILAGNVLPSDGFDVLGKVVVAYKIPGDILKLANEFSQSAEEYHSWASRDKRRAIRWNYLLWLGLITLLILFFAVWVGLYLSKKITIPIRALAEASNEVSRGNLLHRVNCPADDELGILVSSFNRMTAQLYESSQELEQTNTNLQSSNQALEEKSRYTEAVLENIPTGVISIAPDYRVSALNKAAQAILGCSASASGLKIEDLFQPADAGEIRSLLEKATRVGIAAKDLYLRLRDRNLYFAVTISSLDASDSPSQGFVMVLEDLTEVLKAQKANAWREVARRMAHEIKNPLTPIQLSAERILKNYMRSRPDSSSNRMFSAAEYERILNECVQTITQEVATLKSMVDEFSRFARLPAANLVSCNINTIIENTLSSYNGRFQGIRIIKGLSSSLPEVRLDPEQFKRVMVNLIDNALEAMDLSPVKELSILSCFYPQKETVQVIVKDTGQGIAAVDKEKLFLPYFSTRKSGTGLGLAIVNRIVADHKGFIHVEDNLPAGASFVIEIPTR